MAKIIIVKKTGGLISVKVGAKTARHFSLYSAFRFEPDQYDIGIRMYADGKEVFVYGTGDTLQNGSGTISGTATAKIETLSTLFIPA